MKTSDVILTERVYLKFDSKSVSSKEVLVYKNPGYREYIAIKERSKYKELRGLLIGGAVFIWDADLALHNDVSEILELRPDSSFIIDERNRYIGSDPIPVDVSGNLMLKRMLTPPRNFSQKMKDAWKRRK